MIIIKRLIILFMIISFSKSDQKLKSWEESSVQIKVENAIDAIYNYEFETSISLLDSARSLDATHPLIPFLTIVAKWLNTQVNEGYMASYQKIFIEVDSIIPIYNNLIDSYPNNAEYYLYLGCTYGIRSRVSLARNDWFDTIYYGYQGLKLIKYAKSLDEELYDVYMPIGIMEYIACMAPKPVQWVAALLDIDSNCEMALEHLNLAITDSYYSWVEASNVITYIYLHILRDYDKALKVINPLVKKYPRHPFFSFLKAEALVKLNYIDELEKMMPTLVNFSQNGPFLQKNESQLKLAYIRSIIMFNKNRYEEAIKQTNWIINNYHMEFNWLKGFAFLIKGKSYDLIGDRNEAIKAYKKVLEIDDYYPEVKEARLLIKNKYIK
tara:strand:+ start:6672 stop:7814 length:1143 start_codon:yes stop_codon:yes gene_type:complete